MSCTPFQRKFDRLRAESICSSGAVSARPGRRCRCQRSWHFELARSGNDRSKPGRVVHFFDGGERTIGGSGDFRLAPLALFQATQAQRGMRVNRPAQRDVCRAGLSAIANSSAFFGTATEGNCSAIRWPAAPPLASARMPAAQIEQAGLLRRPAFGQSDASLI